MKPVVVRALARGLLAGFSLALGACALGPAHRAATGPAPDPSALTRDFDIVGRISAKRSSEAYAGTLRWRHDARSDDIEFGSPFGQIQARLHGGPDGARVETADGRVIAAADWAALAQNAGSWALPVDGMKSWLLGLPHAGSAYAWEATGFDPPSILRQDGWTISYLGTVTVAGAQRPSRLSLGDGVADIRIVIDAWQ